jgi:hypothetical protein
MELIVCAVLQAERPAFLFVERTAPMWGRGETEAKPDDINWRLLAASASMLKVVGDPVLIAVAPVLGTRKPSWPNGQEPRRVTVSIRSASPRGSGMRAQDFQEVVVVPSVGLLRHEIDRVQCIERWTSRRPRWNVEVQMEKVLRVVLRLHVDETLVVRTVRCTNRV